MRKILFIGLSILCLTGCSEGDVIDVSVDFDAPLESCGNINNRTFVFYKIDNEKNQLLSLNFTDPNFSLSKNYTDSIRIGLGAATNRLIYRKVNNQIIAENYFCTSIPPSESAVTTEYISNNGTAVITYDLIENTSMAESTYQRKIIIENATFVGEGISIRKEFLLLGSEIFSVPK